MKIVVIVKEVPDTEARIVLTQGKPDLSGVKMVIGPYDEYAIEEALQRREAAGEGEVIAVMIGNETSRKTLVNALALGVDRGVLVIDPALEGSDPVQLAKVLKAVVDTEQPDLVLGGRQGVDNDWGLTAIALAELLGWAHAGLAAEITLGDGKFTVKTEGDDGHQTIEGALPAVITAEKGLNEPRYASLKGIMKAKKKPLDVKSLSDLGLDEAEVGGAAARVEFLNYEYPPSKQPGRIIEGETVEEQVDALMDALRNEAKVI